jgi:hypothetical protein
MVQVFHLYGEEVPETLDTKFQAAVLNDKPPHRVEEFLASIFKKYFSNVLTGFYID